MARLSVVGLFLVVVLALVWYVQRGHESPPAPAAALPAALDPALQLPGATLLEGLGNHRFPVTTTHPDVQRWFDQGLILAYGFNHDAAARSFLRASALDPQCAMCWWGAALVLGPHVNATMDPADNAKAWDRLQKAVALAPRTTPREQGVIRAGEARHAAAQQEDRRPLLQP